MRKVRKSGKLIFGVGINDANYSISIDKYQEDGSITISRCPYYIVWTSMLKRSYSEDFLIKNPSYRECCVVPQWHYFMTFRAWMEQQDWQGKVLDKDILSPGNKIYGPDTCVFVSQATNTFIIDRSAKRGEWPLGVHFNKSKNMFQAMCSSVETGKQKHLGFFLDPDEAHLAWLNYKTSQAYILASRQSDPRVAKALIERYKNYQYPIDTIQNMI